LYQLFLTAYEKKYMKNDLVSTAGHICPMGQLSFWHKLIISTVYDINFSMQSVGKLGTNFILQ